MYLFDNHDNGGGMQKLPPLGGAALPTRRKRTLIGVLTGEERPLSIVSLLLVLVLLLHLWVALRLLQPVEPVTLAKPLMMEVSLVSAPSQQQPAATPQAQPKPPIKKPFKQKKPPLKKLVKKKIPVIRKQAELPKPMAMSEPMLPAPSPDESFAGASETTADTATVAKPAEAYSEASFNANYGSNPKPKYPSIARSRGWQGKVLLKVSVSADGLSEAVAVHRSSGHDALDESAVAAVEKWRFTPARRGDTAVACTVIVPIIFTLNH